MAKGKLITIVQDTGKQLQITIPKEISDSYKLSKGNILEWKKTKSGIKVVKVM